MILKNKIIDYALFMVLFASFVFAAGGGGGGSTGGGSSSSDYAYKDLRCDDTGKISFTRSPVLDIVTITAPDGSSLTIPGSWEGYKFISEEGVLVNNGTYTIPDEKYGNQTVECPGLIFSCKLVELTLQECSSTAAGISVKFILKNASVDDLKYQFTWGGGTIPLTYSPTTRSTALSDLTVNSAGANRYNAIFPNGPRVTKVQVSLPQCTGQYYVYTSMNCGEQAPAEPSGTNVKCNGYIDIRDRVICRLNLPEAQADEYENFYPEECRTRSDTEECLQAYKAVQECWDFPNGDARINCVKRVLKLGDILTEKANCNALDTGKRENCNSELKEKVYNLIKFRFYNLEEEAEKLMEQGKLTADEVTDFVVKMEESKVAFNEAKSKQERKDIIIQAREYWIELMRKQKVPA